LYSPLVPICSLVEIPLPVPLLVVTSSVENPVDCANVAIEGRLSGVLLYRDVDPLLACSLVCTFS
jgi:hypothetical protein